MRDVRPEVLEMLASGETESVNLMEWLAADMAALASLVARRLPGGPLADALLDASGLIGGEPLTRRLNIIGNALAHSGVALDSRPFLVLRDHRCDLVRQWACCAVNARLADAPIDRHLEHARRFASDPNMSVREVAWMAFRPRLRRQLDESLPLLARMVVDGDPRQRRFAVEVTRPRSVWGAHVERLKRDPAQAAIILEPVRADPHRYVQLAVGNWLNDAAKTRGDWVLGTCGRWMADGPEAATRHIVRRALRTLMARRAASPDMFPVWPVALEMAR